MEKCIFVNFFGSQNCLPDEKMALKKAIPDGNLAFKTITGRKFGSQISLPDKNLTQKSFQGFHVLHPVVLDMGVALFELMPWKAQPEVQVLAHYISL